jgi:hypothetical protein
MSSTQAVHRPKQSIIRNPRTQYNVQGQRPNHPVAIVVIRTQSFRHRKQSIIRNPHQTCIVHGGWPNKPVTSVVTLNRRS